MHFRIMERLVESCREVKNVLKNTEICWKTYALVSCFALSSWITVNGIWSELPVIIIYAPEKWRLASYIVVIIQVGIVGPLLFSIANRLCPRIFNEKSTIYALIVIGTLSCLFLSLFWKNTTVVDGSPHSLTLLSLVFTLALVDCTSTVVFLTFMAMYNPRYLTALYIGESFCGLLPGIAAIIQGSPKISSCNTTSPNSTTDYQQASGLLFSADAYFLILLAMMVVCGLAFIALNFLPFAKREQRNELFVQTFVTENATEEPSTTFSDNQRILIQEPNSSCHRMSKKHIWMFIMQALACSFTFGIVPSLAPYALEPYGSITYHLVASLGPIGTAIMCFFIIWLKKKSFASVFVAFVVFMCLAIYMVLLAWQSPTPWLHNSHIGKIIAVVVGILISITGTYMRLTISIIMREQSKRALYWCGMSIQIGSFVGAFTIFPFVNILHEFHQRKEC